MSLLLSLLLLLLLLLSAQCVRLFADGEKRVAAALLCQFHFGNSLLHLTTNSIENLSRHSTSDGQRQRRQGRRMLGGGERHSKSIANLKTNLPQRNSKGKRRGEREVRGSTAKLSQRKLRFNSFECVSLFLSVFPSPLLSLCLGAGQV